MPLLGMCGFPFILSAQQTIDGNNTSEAGKVGKGGGIGGGVNVSALSGNVNYTYPISTHSVDGYGVNVSLNYCGSVSMTSYSVFDKCTKTYSSLSKVHPAWLLNVNGFAVQAFTSAMGFQSAWISKSTSALDERHYVWTLDGYDICNRMTSISPHRFPNCTGITPPILPNYTPLYDDIRILRGDGSILELRNANKVENDTVITDISVSGIYYPHGINEKGYAIVSIDSNTYFPSYLKQRLLDEVPHNTRLAWYPRVMKYYPGDGLEYVFREFVTPFDITVYVKNDGNFPTIFYLEEINSDTRTLVSFKRSKHTYSHDVDTTNTGRALLSEFDGHRISYSNTYATIEAMGRTIKLKYNGALSHGLDIDDFADTTLSTFIGTQGERRNYWGSTLAGEYSTVGLINEIIAPDNSVTKMTYSLKEITYDNLEMPWTYYRDCKFGWWRLDKVSTMNGSLTINYTVPTTSLITSSDLASISENQTIDPRVHNVCQSLEYRNSANVLTGKTHYAYIPKHRIINEDVILGKKDTTELFFMNFSASPIRNKNIPFDSSSIRFKPQYASIHYGDRFITLNTTTYQGESLTESKYWILPTEHKTKIIDRKKPSDTLTTSHTALKYTLTELYNYGGDTALAARLGKGILSQFHYSIAPNNSSDTLLKSIQHFQHLSGGTQTGITRVDTTYDFIWSRRLTDSALQAGKDTTIIRYRTQTINNVTKSFAPLWGLTKRTFYTVQGDTLAGLYYDYHTSYTPASPYRRGMMSNYLIRGMNGVTQSQNLPNRFGGPFQSKIQKIEGLFGEQSFFLYNYNHAPLGRVVYSGLTTQTTQKLFERHPEYETPLGSGAIVRWYDHTLTLRYDTLTAFRELTYGGVTKASVQSDALYSTANYDLLSRPTIAWSAGDFPSNNSWKKKTLDIKLWNSSSWEKDTSVLIADNRAEAYKHKYSTRFPEAKGTLVYQATDADPLHNGTSIQNVRLQLYFSNIVQAKESTTFTHEPIIFKFALPKYNWSQNYIMDWDTTTYFTGLQWRRNVFLNYTLPDSLLDSLQAMSAGDTTSMTLSIVSSAVEWEYDNIEIATFADDISPRLVCTPYVAPAAPSDFSVKAIYDDVQLRSTVLGKIDDPALNRNNGWAASLSGVSNRVTGGQSVFSPVNHSSVSKQFIGNPYSPLRIDSAVARLSSQGAHKVIDPEGKSVRATTHDIGIMDSVINTDSSIARSIVRIGKPSDFGLPPDSLIPDYYGLCTVQTSFDETGKKTTSFSDGLGRLRQIVIDSGGLNFITKFVYNNYSQKIYTISPRGDTTKFTYDDWGRIKRVEQPDIGWVENRYNKIGQLRYQQSAQQHIENKITYYEYDDFGRPTIIGEAQFGESSDTSHIWLPSSVNRLMISPYTGILATVNQTMWQTPVTAVPVAPTTMDSIGCLPFPSGNLEHENSVIIDSLFLRHEVGYWDRGLLPVSDLDNFEHCALNPGNPRFIMYYDRFPASVGGIWGALPSSSTWSQLLSQGFLPDYKGKLSAIAYRESAQEPYHYIVYSYDILGRIDAQLRWTENIGFDAVYYTYNASGQIIETVTADPFNKHVTTISYDDNARPDTIRSELYLGSGLQMNNGNWSTVAQYPQYTPPPSSWDIAFTYGIGGKMQSIVRNTSSGLVEQGFRYDNRNRMDSTWVKRMGMTLFRQGFLYDASSRIKEKRDVVPEIYSYDGAERLVKTLRSGGDSTEYSYDAVGNRLSVYKWGIQTDSLRYGDAASPNRVQQSDHSLLNREYSYDKDGAITGIRNSQLGEVTRYEFAYGMRGLTNGFSHIYYGSAVRTHDNCEDTIVPMTWRSDRNIWKYRYNGTGGREQKRLYYSQDADSCKMHPWVYYLLDIGNGTRAIWHGRQTMVNTACES